MSHPITATLLLAVLLTASAVASAATTRRPSGGPCPTDPSQCQLPACLCSSTSPPSNLTDPPQIVTVTFDDGVNDQTFPYYDRLRKLGLRNPGGRAVGFTFFVNHDYTDYRHVHDLWSAGYEIGLHSISKNPDLEYWRNASEEQWTREIADQRIILNEQGLIPLETIRGMRAPYIQPGGDEQFPMLQRAGLVYDSSLSTIFDRDPPLWPHTLQYRSTQWCNILPCPRDSYPGVWEFPLVALNHSDALYSTVETCKVAEPAEIRRFLTGNFRRHYDGNRAPFGLHIGPAWFACQDGVFDELVAFLTELNKLDDVHIVSMSQALRWMEDPGSLNDTDDSIGRPHACGKPQTCYYPESSAPDGGERWLVTCAGKCPEVHPWLGNPEGKRTNITTVGL